MGLNEKRKIDIGKILDDFVKNEDETEYEFQPDLSNTERAVVHKMCQKFGLSSKSRGTGQWRHIVVYKSHVVNSLDGRSVLYVPELSLKRRGYAFLHRLLSKFPTNESDLETLAHVGVQCISLPSVSSASFIQNGPGVPPLPLAARVDPRILATKLRLPVAKLRDNFLQLSKDFRLLLVTGETGSGKSTQLPQFILDDAATTGTPCRVVVTEPRRIAAITLAERVAAERGETAGRIVGYQIRLENCTSPNTLLTFCTNGILLKTLMYNRECLQSITHLFIDEVHERDKISDFLLIIIRDIMPNFPHLRVILMSASLDSRLFQNYFTDWGHLHVEGNSFHVDDYFLEDILFTTQYVSKALRKATRPKHLIPPSVDEQQQRVFESSNIFQGSSTTPRDMNLDCAYEQAWRSGDGLYLSFLASQIIQSGSVNYQHSGTGVTLLMIAAGLGNTVVLSELLSKGADAKPVCCNSWQALHWAQAFGTSECVDILGPLSDSGQLVSVYHSIFDDDRVDSRLIVELLAFIYAKLPPGGILIFLPGYEDILCTKEAILSDERLKTLRLNLCVLHSQMRNDEHRRAFESSAENRNKIVLSTNIAEVSVTVEDIVYVIDTGKMKQKAYDAVGDVSALTSIWIAKSNVTQRTGRAGRCQNGICFHLYSKLRYNSMPDSQVPEMLRVRIHELCLQTKQINPDIPSVASFLEKAPDPPPKNIVNSSVQLLKTIKALDLSENLTILGRRLIDLPVDPPLGKMLLYGVYLKCLDPVLTIAAAMSYGDPFSLPRLRHLLEKAAKKRVLLARFTPMSDHGVLMTAFKGWQNAHMSNAHRTFAWENYLSNASLEMISGIKNLLFNTLREAGYYVNAVATASDWSSYVNINSDKWPVIRAVLVAGSYPNVACVNRFDGNFMTKTCKAGLNPSSVLGAEHTQNMSKRDRTNFIVGNLPSDWVIFKELNRQNAYMQMNCVTGVTSAEVALFAGDLNVGESNIVDTTYVDRENETWVGADDGVVERSVSVIELDDWLKVRVNNRDGAIKVVQMRQKLHASFLRRLMEPSASVEEEEVAIVDSVVGFLCSCDKE